MEGFYWEHRRGGATCRRYWGWNSATEGNRNLSICTSSVHRCFEFSLVCSPVVGKPPQFGLVQDRHSLVGPDTLEADSLTSWDWKGPLDTVQSIRGHSRWVWDVSRQGDSMPFRAAVPGFCHPHGKQFFLTVRWNLGFNFYAHCFLCCCCIPLKSVRRAAFHWSWTEFSVSSLQGMAEGALAHLPPSSDWVGVPSYTPDSWRCCGLEQQPPVVLHPETPRDSFCCSYTCSCTSVGPRCAHPPGTALPWQYRQRGWSVCVCMGTEAPQPQLPSLLCSWWSQHHRVTEGPSLPRPRQPLPKHQRSHLHTTGNAL